MSFTIELTTQLLFTATETADTTTSPASGAQGAARVFDAYNLYQTLRSTSTPAPSGRVVDLSLTTGGADTTIDLTAAPIAGDVSKTVDLTGKKLLGYIIRARSTNVGTVTIKPHPSSNGYNLFGDASGQVTLGPGRHLTSIMQSGYAADTPAVAAGAKNIRITVGTVGDKIDILAVFGT